MSLTIETARMMDNDHLIAALEAEGMGPRIQELVNRIEILEDEAREFKTVLDEYELSPQQLEDLLEATGRSVFDACLLLRVLAEHEHTDAEELGKLLNAVEVLRNL